MTTSAFIYYAHDPMCSWCWGFKPVYQRLRKILQDTIEFRLLLGGLAKDTQEPMSEEIKAYLIKTWETIESRIPDCQFNFDFWDLPTLKRSTYPACRAVIAAREQQQNYAEAMIAAIQQAYYQQARNTALDEVLIELAGEIGLDVNQFAKTLNATRTNHLLQDEISLCRHMSVSSFPTLILDIDSCHWKIPINYLDATPMLNCINEIIDAERKT